MHDDAVTSRCQFLLIKDVLHLKVNVYIYIYIFLGVGEGGGGSKFLQTRCSSRLGDVVSGVMVS